MGFRKGLFGTALLVLIALVGGLLVSPVVSRSAALNGPGLSSGSLQKTPYKVSLEGLAELPVAQADLRPEDQPASKTDLAIQEAFFQEAQARSQQILGLLVYEPFIDSIHYAADGSSALVWVGLRDPQTQEVLATEPGLAIASNLNADAPEAAASWRVTLQSTEPFQGQLEALPADLISDDIRMRYLEAPQPDLSSDDTNNAALSTGPLRGYKLPWTYGVARRVTNSIGHYLSVAGGLTSCPGTCQFAYDFADGTMFPLLASKGGTVKAVKTSCANYVTNCTNYLILEDQSTNPVTYQVYYHMAFNSVPARLRTIGAMVNQGEYIGDVDDTGYSTGHHLHYHVYRTATQTDWSWGYSVDFRYDDVKDNDGRPRTCAEASAYPSLGAQCQKENKYISGNVPAHPPTGTLSAPSDRLFLDGKTVTVSGTANDDISIARIQVIANWDGTWKVIDDIPPVKGAFSKEVDLCTANVPDGPFALSVRIYDYEGSQAAGLPMRQVIKNFACSGVPPAPPPPACTPGDNQVALYADRDFRGACQRFNINDAGYLSNQLGAVGDNNAASIQVGKNVRAILYERSSDVTAPVVKGRLETFESSDASLADNRIGIDTLSGMRVVDRSMPPDEPFFNTPVGHLVTSGANPKSIDSLDLAWEGGEGATTFDVTLRKDGVTTLTKTVTTNALSLGSLPAGLYTGEVRAKNASGSNGTDFSFRVDAASLPAATARSVPFTDYLEDGPGDWVASGLWRHTTVSITNWPASKAWVFNTTNKNYNDSTYKAGDLTSPPVTLPANVDSYLRFAYYADVEGGSFQWDQRWVQISVDGGPFTNLRQLVDDKQAIQSWLNSGPISLAAYRGKTVRVRFHFNSMDEDWNSGFGWVVDDVTINTQAPEESCKDDGSVLNLELNSTVSGVICPEGDRDLFKITGTAGQTVIFDIDAATLNPPSALDTIIYLLDADQRSVLAWNDDEKSGSLVDSLLTYGFNRSGTYYLRVKAWDHPGAGGSKHVYNLSYKPYTLDLKKPTSVSMVFPVAPNMIPTHPFEMSVAAVDHDGGPVKQVDFYWHGPNWTVPNWVRLTPDTNPNDGWTVILDPLAYGTIPGSALYVQATSRSGGVSGVVWWNLQPDTTPPVSSMEPLPALLNTTAIQIKWSATDTTNDVQYFEVQYQVDGGPWNNWNASNPNIKFPANVRTAWMLGEQGKTYGFQVRGVDQQGNVENFPNKAMATTRIAESCTPDANEVPSQSSANATILAPRAKSAQSNLCKSSAPRAGGGDEDWYALTLKANEPLILMAYSQGGGARLTMDLFDAQNRLLGSWSSVNYGATVGNGKFAAPTDGTYYLRVTGRNHQPFGTDVRYQVWYAPARWLFMPLIMR